MTDDHVTAYDGVSAKSNERVPLYKWRVVMAGLIVMIAAGIMLVIALANGAANPPRATHLIIDLPSDEGLETVPPFDLPLVASLRSYEFPITIEVAAQTSNTSSAAWGIWLRSLDAQYTFQLRSDGYFSMLFNGAWQEFIHIQPTDNKLDLYIDSEGNATFRINNEIAWRGDILSDLLEWGLIRPTDSPIDWRYIRLYSG